MNSDETPPFTGWGEWFAERRLHASDRTYRWGVYGKHIQDSAPYLIAYVEDEYSALAIARAHNGQVAWERAKRG